MLLSYLSYCYSYSFFWFFLFDFILCAFFLVFYFYSFSVCALFFYSFLCSLFFVFFLVQGMRLMVRDIYRSRELESAVGFKGIFTIIFRGK